MPEEKKKKKKPVKVALSSDSEDYGDSLDIEDEVKVFKEEKQVKAKTPTGTPFAALGCGTIILNTPTPITRIIISCYDKGDTVAYPMYNAGFRGYLTVTNWSLATQGSESPVGIAIIESVDPSQEITFVGRLNIEARPNSTLAKDLKVEYDPNSVLEDIDWAKRVISNKEQFGLRNVYAYSDYEKRCAEGQFLQLASRGVHIGKTWAWRDMARGFAGGLRKAIPIVADVGLRMADLITKASSFGEINTTPQ